MRCTFGQRFMKIFAFFFLGLTAAPLFAQVDLYLKSNLAGDFELFIDSYHQGQSESGQMHLKGLPLAEYQLTFQSPDSGYYFHQRAFQPPQPGAYYYVLDKNFREEVVLRYRGTKPEEAASFKRIDFNRKLTAGINQPAIKVPGAPPPPPPPPSEVVLAEIEEDPSQEIDEILLSSQDSASDAEAALTAEDSSNTIAAGDSNLATEPARSSHAEVLPLDTAKAPAPPRGFEEKVAQLKAIAFEFERLQFIQAQFQPKDLDIAQWQTLLAQLKYDQTRLQLLQWAFAQAPVLKEQIEDFKPSLEYDTSRQQLSSYGH